MAFRKPQLFSTVGVEAYVHGVVWRRASSTSRIVPHHSPLWASAAQLQRTSRSAMTSNVTPHQQRADKRTQRHARYVAIHSLRTSDTLTSGKHITGFWYGCFYVRD